MAKFQDPFVTAKGEERAFVDLKELRTLWFNTGTICNLTCENCYIESSPKNDRLSFINEKEVGVFLDEIREDQHPVKLIGLTGGEPFANPHIQKILNLILERGFEVLVLTNAYKAIHRHRDSLLKLREKFGERLKIRVSLDHYTAEIHEKERGAGTFLPTLEEILWLTENGIALSIAGRSLKKESADAAQKGYQELLKRQDIPLVIFPEMDQKHDVPEITTACWGILNKSPSQEMCSSERMIVKEKASGELFVMPCTLLAYDDQFKLGKSLRDARPRVQLNHPFCAKFCVLGGSSCSGTK